jgi:MoxR-like ATPase
VLRYVWDREEQIDPLAALVNGLLKAHPAEEAAHPLAALPERVDGEELAGQLDAAERDIAAGGLSLTALARLRERVAELADRAAWVTDGAARPHLLARAGKLLDRLGR